MANVYKYLVLMVGLTILFTLAGIPTGMGLILEKLGVDIVNNPENIALSNLFFTIGGILAAATTVGIAISIAIGSGERVTFALAGYGTLLASFVADMAIITTFAFATYSAWVGYIVLLIMLPIAIGYLHAVISWWGGK